MNKRIIMKSMFDGLSNGLIWYILGFLPVCGYTSTLSLDHYLIIAVFAAILSAGIYIALAPKQTSKNFVLFSVIGILWSALWMAILLTVRMLFPIDFLSPHEVNNANGIMILFAQGCYILVSFILRICCFVVWIIRNARRKRKTGNGALS